MQQCAQRNLPKSSDIAPGTSSHDPLCLTVGPFLESPRVRSERVAIKSNKKITFVDSIGLISVTARGRYVVVHHKCGSYLLRDSLSRIEKKLVPYGFVRIHKSLLINGAWVYEIRPHLNGEYQLVLKDGRELKTSRLYKRKLLQLAALWL